MGKVMAVVGGASVGFLAGAGTMFLLDPAAGRRRRKLLRDQAVHETRLLQEGLDMAARDLGHRAQGLLFELRGLLDPHPVPDGVLVDRVRSKLGRVVSHPGAIEVSARDGHVVLSGDVLAHEAERLKQAVALVRGVKDVADRLQLHKDASGVPALQGGVPRPGERPDVLQTHWAPRTRLLASIAGGSLLLWGVGRGGAIGVGSGLLGATLLLRAVSNLPLSRALGLGPGRRGIDVQKTIHIAAAPEQVFAFWSHYENFPRFMHHVREVRPVNERRSHWVVAGPAGIEVEWDADVTRLQPGRLISWRSVPGSSVRHAGTVRFQPEEDGTRVDVRMSYKPPAGALGHTVAALFGADPKREMDEDLLRMKTLIETGNPPHDAAQPGPPNPPTPQTPPDLRNPQNPPQTS